MDGKGREGTHIFFSRRLAGAAGGAGHRAQEASGPPATSLAPPMPPDTFCVRCVAAKSDLWRWEGGRVELLTARAEAGVSGQLY